MNNKQLCKMCQGMHQYTVRLIAFSRHLKTLGQKKLLKKSVTVFFSANSIKEECGSIVSSSTLCLLVLAFVQLQAESFLFCSLLIALNATLLKWISLKTMMEVVGYIFNLLLWMMPAEAVVNELSETLARVLMPLIKSQGNSSGEHTSGWGAHSQLTMLRHNPFCWHFF